MQQPLELGVQFSIRILSILYLVEVLFGEGEFFPQRTSPWQTRFVWSDPPQAVLQETFGSPCVLRKRRDALPSLCCFHWLS